MVVSGWVIWTVVFAAINLPGEDLTDTMQATIAAYLSGKIRDTDRTAASNYLFLNAVLWIGRQAPP